MFGPINFKVKLMISPVCPPGDRFTKGVTPGHSLHSPNSIWITTLGIAGLTQSVGCIKIPKMNIVLACDRHIFHGLLTTVASLIWHEKHCPLKLHILDGGLTQAQWEMLSATTTRLNPATILIRHRFDQTQVSHFSSQRELGLMTYARIFIPAIIKVPSAVYIDSDFLVTRPVSGLLPYFNSGHAVCGVAESGVNLSKDFPDMKEPDIAGYDYFNGGLMLLNLERWRDEKISETLMAFLQNESSRCPFADQSAINWVLRGKIGKIPEVWNTFSHYVDWGVNGASEQPGTVNLHFIGRTKPWKRPVPGLSHKLWWLFTRRFAGNKHLPRPLLNPRNVFRYVRRTIQEPPPFKKDLWNAWKLFWDDSKKI